MSLKEDSISDKIARGPSNLILLIDIAKSAVCSFLTCNDRYDWSVYTVCFSPINSAQLVLNIGLLRGVTSSLMGYW